MKLGGSDQLLKFKEEYHNTNLEDLLLSKLETNKIEEYRDRLIRKDEPVFKQPEMSFGRAHFFAPEKRIFNFFIDTYWFNLFVIIIMTLFFYMLLLTEALSNLIELIDSYRYNDIFKKLVTDLKSLIKPIIKNNRTNDAEINAFY